MSNQYYNGTVHFTIEAVLYTATVHARATYSFRPGRMYLSNGDPGYPPEEDFEIDDVEVRKVVDEEDNEVKYDEDTMYDLIYDELKDVDWVQEEWEPPEPPDWDY